MMNNNRNNSNFHLGIWIFLGIRIFIWPEHCRGKPPAVIIRYRNDLCTPAPPPHIVHHPYSRVHLSLTCTLSHVTPFLHFWDIVYYYLAF